MKSVCVFCGSSPGDRPEYMAAAKLLGSEMARQGLRLVYGGASVGMMGEIAKSVLAGGGRVTGVIPKALRDKEVALTTLEDLRVVDSMHERKALMAELSDGFIAMPGGLGTLEEFVEVLTWSQLGLHCKPCGLLNIVDYYKPFIGLIDHMVEQKFVNPAHRKLLLMAGRPALLLEKMAAWQPPVVDKAKWILELSAHRADAA
ncbi:MAG: TIGR00730 family Rossman fold protein [Desulfobacteraceae bacterium]|nr:TIGR00730 family Rossman fold protein [Desulfobacteraceae bacterium]